MVLDVRAAEYHPAPGAHASSAEEAICLSWSLDKQQAGRFLTLSTELGEGELHRFDWLPCSIKGRASVQGAMFEFEINAAGTSTWRNGETTRLMGCSLAECGSLLILVPGGEDYQ